MKQKITQMKLARHLFTAVLALIFISCNKGYSSDEPKSNNGAQTTSSKQAEDEIGFGQRELTLQVGETAKVTLHGVRSPRIETSNSNLVEATLIEQGTAVSLKGLQAGEGTIRVFSSNRYAELRVVVKANEEDLFSPFNGKNIIWNEITSNDYTLRDDSLTLEIWRNNNTKNLDMNRDPLLRKIKVIGSQVFARFNNLTNVNISNSTTTIRDYAFTFCESLTGVNISNSVTSIGKGAFSNCSSLTNIHIPSSVTSIDEWAFSNCSSLTNIHIPSSVTSIDEWAFSNCSSLTNIHIPSSVTSIEKNVFSGCSTLTSVNIPNSVTSIEEQAFADCESLTSITISSSLTNLSVRAFAGCRNLTSIVFKGNNPPQSSASEVFGNTPSNLKFIVPKGAKSRYIRAGYPEDNLIER